MFISVPLLAGGAIASCWVVGKYIRNQKRPSLVELIASPSEPRHPKRTDSFGELGKSAMQKLAPDRLVPSQLKSLLQQVDDHYQALIHNTVDRMFGEHYEKHLQALGKATGTDAIPLIVKQRNRQAGYAGVAFVLALTHIPALMATSFAINLYLSYVVVQIGFQDMRQERKLTARGRNGLLVLAILSSGYLALESASLVFTLFIEKFTETVQGQSHERLANVFGELPQSVSRLQDGIIVVCPLREISAGDVVVVYAGEVIPVDGQIIAGHASIDQHALTGEAQPYEAESGDSVFASTLVLMGEIQVQVVQANAETLAAQITDILNNTLSHETQVGLRGIEIANKWVLPTTVLGLLAWPIWGVSSLLAVWLMQPGFMLMVTTPMVLLAYLDMSARSNILVKDGRSLELLSDIDTLVFDKTGTLTEEIPTVCGLHRSGDLSDDELLALAAAIEERQSHPIATAIRDAAAAQGLTLPLVDETRIELGYGLAVTVDGKRVLLGSQRYMTQSNVSIPDDIQQLSSERQAIGHSMVYLAIDGVLEGVIELQPTVRPEAQAVVDALHERDIELAMITGDQQAPAQALAETLGIDRVFANVLPEQKAELVSELQEQGRRVMFVGDGINDSIALKQAHVSVSIAGATTVATDTAQIVLMDGTLLQLDTLFDLAERYERDLQGQYVLGVYVPVVYISGVLLLGWGMVSSYVVGYTVFLSAMGLAFRPIWRQERLESKQQQSLTEPVTSEQ